MNSTAAGKRKRLKNQPTTSPLAEGSAEWSGYNYVGDNPINIIDPDGLQWSTTTHIPFWGSEAGFGAGWNIAGAGGSLAGGVANTINAVNAFTPGFSSTQNFSNLGSAQGNEIRTQGPGAPASSSSNNSFVSKGLNIISKLGIPALSSSARSGLELQQGHYIQAGIDEVSALAELFTWESAIKYKIPNYTTAAPEALTAAEMGERIGWGTGQSTEAVQKTLSLVRNITSEDIATMQSEGVTKEFIEQQLRQYNDAILKGGSKLRNSQLLPRKALMEKILRLWK